MTLSPFMFSRRSLISLITRILPAFFLWMTALLVCSSGCWSCPTYTGTWSGTISQRKLYVANGKECYAALFKLAAGVVMSPELGSGYLVDADNRLIDASSFDPHEGAKVSGIAGFMLVTDLKGASVETIKNFAPGTEIGAIRVNKNILSSGKTVDLRLAVDERAPATAP